VSPRAVPRSLDDERRDAARLLLRRPLVHASGPDADGYRLVRRHQDYLVAMFRQQLGYRLVVEPHFARLFKAGLGWDGGRYLDRRSGAPFGPRDYLYLALSCAALLTARRQLLLSSLVSDVRQAAAEAGIDVGDDSGAERRALVHALERLVKWGALTEDDGSVGGYADDPEAEALLWVDHDVIRSLLAVGLRDVDDAASLVRVAASPGPDGVRHAVRRRIVEEPVVAVDELPDDQRAWLRQYQRREERSLDELFGLQLEIRAEGVAAFDRREELTDVEFPRSASLGQLALLAVSELVRVLRPGDRPPARDAAPTPSVIVPAGLLEQVVANLLDDHARRWSKEVTDRRERTPTAVEGLLVEAGLLRHSGVQLHLRAVAGRYAPTVEVDNPAADAAGSCPAIPLFDPGDLQ